MFERLDDSCLPKSREGHCFDFATATFTTTNATPRNTFTSTTNNFYYKYLLFIYCTFYCTNQQTSAQQQNKKKKIQVAARFAIRV